MSAKIARQLKVLWSPGGIHELRVPGPRGKPAIASGYFDSPEAMAEAAFKLNQQGYNTYFTINPVCPDILGRVEPNKIVFGPEMTTDDNEIASRWWLFLDVDVNQQVRHIAATDEQHKAALECGRRIRQWLMEDFNWPAPIMVDSGNGSYPLFRINEPNDEATKLLLGQVTKAIANKSDGDGVKTDPVVFNASRVVRVPGTLNRKGRNTAERPHRVAALIDVPEEIEVVTGEQLEQVARLAPTNSSSANGDGRTSASLELEQVFKAIEARGIAINHDGNKHHLSECLFDSSHSGGTSVAIIEYASGAKVYACKHPPCSGDDGKTKWKWGDVLAKLGLAEKKANPGFELMKLSYLMKKKFPPDKYLWAGRLVVGTVSLVIAKPKVGKTTLARNIALAVARGEELLGFKVLKGMVIYLALEELAQDMQEDWRAMGVLVDGDEELYLHAAPNPVEGLLRLTELIRERKPALVVIDPLFRFTKIKDEKAYAETYTALGPLIDIARETGTHVMLLHHGGKMPKTDPIDSPLGSTALGGVPATLIYLARFGEKYRTICTVQRRGDNMPETVLLLDKNTKKLTLGGSKDAIEQHDAEQCILKFLEGGPQTHAQIKEGVGGATKVVWAALTALVRPGAC